jgi:peptide-methionine (S)-S-oxide reductase
VPASLDAALKSLAAWPPESHRGRSGGKDHMVSKSSFADGRAVKMVARELGGADYVSLNLYLLEVSPQIFPCEMPLEKVLDFPCDLRRA